MSRLGMQSVKGVVCGAILGLATIASSAYGQTRITPAISVSESYDTNVYFTSSGAHLQDYVTTVTPQLRGEHKSRLLDASGQISVMGSTYVRNPALNYFAPTASINVGLDQLTGLVDQRWKLAVNDYVTYTPQPPAFFSPPVGQGGGTTTAPEAPENFLRGVQAVRANSLVNVGGITSQYVLTSVTTLVGAFQHQYMRFGTAFAPTPGAGFFTTTFASLNAGPQFQVTPRDVLSVNGNYSRMAFDLGNGNTSTFAFQGVTGGWSRKFSPKLSANATAGVTMFSTGGSLQYLGSASLTYQERNTTFIGSYSRSVFPSFFIAATPLLSQVFTASVMHTFTPRLSATGSVNYGKNEAIGNTALQFDSYSGTAGLNYTIAKTWSIYASYTHMVAKSVFLGSNFEFDRDVFTVTLRKEWPDFFKPN